MSLANWHAMVGSDRVIACIGDSVFENLIDIEPTLGWVQKFRQSMDPTWSNRGNGFFGMFRVEWTTAGSWTKSTNSDAWDKAPWGEAYTASGSSAVKTWTKSSEVTGTINRFELFVVDGASSANFSYRIDGGAWTNVSNTWNQNNSLDTITINSPVTSTVEVRAANAAGTSVNVYLVGISVYFQAGGLVVHNLGKRSDTIITFTRSTTGDWGAWLDLVQPDLVIIEDSNHGVYINNPTEFAVDLNQLVDRVQAYADVVFFVVPEQNNGRDVTMQSNYRQRMRDVAYQRNATVFDLSFAWGNYATASGNGLWYPPVGVHPSDTGHTDISTRIQRLLTQPRRGPKVRST